MEQFTGEKYSPCIKKWLIHAGYNKLVALAELNEDRVAKVEGHINENPDLVTNLKCCYSETYQNQTTFSFLPGHKATILGIGQQVARMKEQHTTVKLMPNKPKPKVKKIQSATHIKSMLIEKLIAYPGKHGVKLLAGVISEGNIMDFEATSKDGEVNGAQCVFSCPLCVKFIPTSYTTHWKSSNVTNHIRTHVEDLKKSGGVVTYEEAEVVQSD